MTVRTFTTIPPGIARAVVGISAASGDSVFFADAFAVLKFDMVMRVAIDNVASRIEAIHRFDVC